MKHLVIGKIGVDAEAATDPNDFVFDSRYNTPKIVKRGLFTSQSVSASTRVDFSASHGLGYTPLVFAQANYSGSSPLRLLLPGGQDPSVPLVFENLRVDATDIHWIIANNHPTDDLDVDLSYQATEIPLAGTPSFSLTGGKRLIIAKSGFDAETETNPNNLIYDSKWNTLKYFRTGSKTINIPSSAPPAVYEEVIYNHALGYYPLWTASIDISVTGDFIIMPESFGDAGFEHAHDCYMTTQDLKFRYTADNAFASMEGGYSVVIRWKIFSFSL